MLANVTIRRLIESGVIGMDPYDPKLVQPCSYDLTLGDVDLIRREGSWSIPPGVFCLGSTRERVRLPANMAGTIQGKSTWGRKGLVVEDAGHVDAGFDGELTLELFNYWSVPIVVFFGEPIAQIIFTYLDVPADPPYQGRYQGQTGPTQARG